MVFIDQLTDALQKAGLLGAAMNRGNPNARASQSHCPDCYGAVQNALEALVQAPLHDVEATPLSPTRKSESTPPVARAKAA